MFTVHCQIVDSLLFYEALEYTLYGVKALFLRTGGFFIHLYPFICVMLLMTGRHDVMGTTGFAGIRFGTFLCFWGYLILFFF